MFRFLALILVLGGFAPLSALLMGGDMKEDARTRTGANYDFKKDIMPIFDTYCVSCHGPEKKKGGVKITDMDPDIVNGPHAEKWFGMLDVLNLGEMPPEDKKQPTTEERRKIVEWLTVELKRAAEIKRGNVTTVIRRLNKQQYTNTLQELLGIQIDFGKELPGDGQSHEGFQNNGETLSMSRLQMEYYLKIARMALDQAIVGKEAPEVYKFRIDIGTGISPRKGSRGLGYVSVPIPFPDFKIQELEASNKGFKTITHHFQPFTDLTQYKDTEIDKRLSESFFLDMRGSDKNRFQVTKDGIVLLSSVPHQEQGASLWHGPSPNLTVIMRDFPKRGDFIMNVAASQSSDIQEEAPTPPAAQFEAKTTTVAAPKNALIIYGQKPTTQKGLNMSNPRYVQGQPVASYDIDIPQSGLYQFDAVYAADEERPLDIKIGDLLIQRTLGSTTNSWDDLQLKSNGEFELKKGKQTLSFDSQGASIPHIHAFILTPVKSGRSLLVQKTPKTAINTSAPYLRAFAGNRTDDGMEYATFDKPQKVTALLGDTQILTFKGRLENIPLPTIDLNDLDFMSNMAVLGLWNDTFVTNKKETGAPVLIKSIEFEGPYYETWPPKSHTDIFIASKNKENREIYTREILTRFIAKAFRRTPTTSEIEKLITFWKDNHKDYATYEEGIKELLVIVLCSRDFLYLAEPIEKNKSLTDYQLASRLSYFLWDSMPDARLSELARTGSLKKNLTAEVKRMVQDPKAFAFSKAFTYQWLDMRRLENIGINIKMYPQYTRFVKEDMTKETPYFFHEVLTKNLSVMNFIDSDFVMVNQNLAQFYGIKDVFGSEFRRVDVPRSDHRGGLLSQGSFLTGHSSGDDSHPIKRGVWLIRKILDNPPPEPPPNVPMLDESDPKLAKLTKKQQLENHRNHEACNDCHAKIDPWGVAFEGYDAIGLLRSQIKTKSGNMPVDAKSTLPSGKNIDGISGLKAFMLENERENITRSIVKYLLSYALGRSLNFTDDAQIKAIMAKAKNEDYKMQAIIEGIVTCALFTER